MDAVHEFVAKLVRGKKLQLLTKVAWTLVSLMSIEIRLQKVASINSQW
tara:strand:- start:232 stop:375 length:144 start_codon:yes stop_codon:yes gene_type:complete